MTTTIEDLPLELLVKIFSYYVESWGHREFSRNVVPVCTTWWRLSSMPSLWKNIDVRNCKPLLSLSKRGLLRHTQRLRIHSNCSVANIPKKPRRSSPKFNNQLSAVLSNIRDLKCLEISKHPIDANTVMIVAKHCPNLEDLKMSHLDYRMKMTLQDMDPILTICGPKLKRLEINYCIIKEERDQAIEEISAKCPSLEIFRWSESKFSIYELARRCPRLRELYLEHCELVGIAENDGPLFQYLILFSADECDFRELDLSNLLKKLKNLEILFLLENKNVIYGDISKISSNKVRHIFISPEDDIDAIYLVGLEQAMGKWKHTLECLEIGELQCDITDALKVFLDDNQCPKLRELRLEEAYVDSSVLKILALQCQNMDQLAITIRGEEECTYFDSREHIIEFLDSL